MLDIVIQDCLIVDGTGAPRFRADVAVQGERIAGIGRFDTAQVKQSINASGLVCAPGFIDMHSHADLTLPICPTADSMIHQGITRRWSVNVVSLPPRSWTLRARQ